MTSSQVSRHNSLHFVTNRHGCYSRTSADFQAVCWLRNLPDQWRSFYINDMDTYSLILVRLSSKICHKEVYVCSHGTTLDNYIEFYTYIYFYITYAVMVIIVNKLQLSCLFPIFNFFCNILIILFSNASFWRWSGVVICSY